jgi:hypothetical protein
LTVELARVRRTSMRQFAAERLVLGVSQSRHAPAESENASAGKFLPHIFITRFRRPVDLASRRTKTTVRLGIHVRCAIITSNLSLSI